jgi:hypothetical protein
MKQVIEQAVMPPDEQPLPPEVVSFCALLARILHRCMQEQNPEVLALLGLTPERQENAHEQAA